MVARGSHDQGWEQTRAARRQARLSQNFNTAITYQNPQKVFVK